MGPQSILQETQGLCFWPLQSPDLTNLVSFLWYLKGRVYVKESRTILQLINNIHNENVVKRVRMRSAEKSHRLRDIIFHNSTKNIVFFGTNITVSTWQQKM